MRVLMVAPTPFFAHRGCHVRILEETRALAQRGHEVEIVTYGLGDDVPDVRIRRSVRIPWYRKRSAGPSWHKLYMDVLLVFTIARAVRRFRPDVVHAHLHEGVFLAVLARLMSRRTPIVGDFQGSMTSEMADHGFFSRWAWGEHVFSRLEGWINRVPDVILVSSRQGIPPIAECRRDGEARIRFLPDGVDSEAFRPDADGRAKVRRRLGWDEDATVVGFLGLLTTYQGVDALLAAAAEVHRIQPDVRFLVMGFPNVEHYQELARKNGLGDAVVFPGRIPYEEASEWLSAVDVAVSPKLSLSEANGKLLNYMACGLPTVVFESGINRELLGDAGVFAKYDDTESLAEAIVELVRDPERRRSVGATLRRRAMEDFSWQSRAEELETVYGPRIAS